MAAQKDTSLSLTKTLYTRQNTKAGPLLVAVKGPVEVGDELVVRFVLRTDRDLEFVHLKDHRGAGVEPVSVLSRYKCQDGLGYYETTLRHGNPLLHRLPAQGQLCLRVSHARGPARQVSNRFRGRQMHVRARVQQPLGKPVGRGR